MLTQINTSITATAQNLILLQNFRLQMVALKKNVIIFGADMSSSVHTDHRNKNILILRKGPTQELYDTRLTAEAKYPINFTQSGKRFVLSLHYNGCFLFVSAIKIYQFKPKTLK